MNVQRSFEIVNCFITSAAGLLWCIELPGEILLNSVTLYHVCNGFCFKFYALDFIRDAISRIDKEAKKRVSG